MSKLLLYCTKAKPYLQVNRCVLPTEYDRYILSKEQYYSAFGEPLDKLNGKIVAECDFEVEELINYHNSVTYYTQSLNQQELLNKSCLGIRELDNYLKGKNGYAIHIKNLHIFDKLGELSEFAKDNTFPIDYAPSKMIHIWYYNEILEKWERSIYVPVSSQELCRILNKEQTTLVRRYVLKEMLKNE